MEQSDYIDHVRNRLSQDSFRLHDDQIDEFDVIIAMKKQFRWSWAATQLNLIAVVGISEDISLEVIKHFSSTALKYAIKHKGGLLRGLQSGVVSFAVLASASVADKAKEWVQQRPPRHFAAFEMPVIFDLNQDMLYYYATTPVWGGLYYGFFQHFIETHFKTNPL